MWHKLQENHPYFLLITQKEGLQVFVTDHITIWFVYYSKKGFLACLQESNFGLDVDINEFIEKGTDLLLNPSGLRNLVVTKGVSSLEVAMTKLFEYPLKLKLKLVEGSKEMFFQHVTQLLIRNISDLKSSQQQLRELLKKKDDEIEEYKCEGKEIAIRYLKTIKFNDQEHMNQHQVYMECGELLDVPLSLLKKIAANESVTVKEEKMEISLTEVKLESHTPTKPSDSQCTSCDTSSNNGNMQQLKVNSSCDSVSPRKKKKPLLNY